MTYVLCEIGVRAENHREKKASGSIGVNLIKNIIFGEVRNDKYNIISRGEN